MQDILWKFEFVNFKTGEKKVKNGYSLKQAKKGLNSNFKCLAITKAIL